MELCGGPGLSDCPERWQQMNRVAEKTEIKNEELACVLGLIPEIVGVAHIETDEAKGGMENK